MAESDLTAQRLRELLDYDPKSGLFIRKTNAAWGTRVGDVAGGINNEGYINIRLDGVLHKAHRLAWLYTHGEWPSGMIDHMNGDRADNRINNLRVVLRAANMQNQRVAQKSNRLGFLGVTRHGRKFRAHLSVAKKNVYLGLFDTPELAHAAYLDAKRRLHPGCTI